MTEAGVTYAQIARLREDVAARPATPPRCVRWAARCGAPAAR